MINMPEKFKRMFVEIVVILITVIVSAFIYNELRADKLPILPHYDKGGFYRTMSLNDFPYKEGKNFQGYIFDARPHALYEKEHLAPAKNFPVSEFDFFYPFYLTSATLDTPVFVYGRTLSNAYDLELAHRLFLKGFRNVTVLL
jgi:hypothetical protein